MMDTDSGYINSTGKELLECNYNDISRITEIDDDKNVYLLATLNGKVGLVKNNKTIINNDYVAIEYDKPSKLLILNNESAKGVSNLDGKIIIPVDYDYISIGGDYITTQKGDSKLVFDLSGNKINTEWASHEKINDNYSIVIDSEGYYNVLDNSNQKMLKDKYIYIEYYTNDLFIATKDSTTGIINANEQIIVPIKYGTLQKIDGTNLIAGTLSGTGRVDIITGTLGKALGGASGGYTSGRKEIIDLLRQRSRPYLFSNTLAPGVVGASIKLFDLLKNTSLRDHLEELTLYYRNELKKNNFDIIDSTHPIVPIMLYDEKLAVAYAKKMMEKGIYVVAFSYPVVPKGKARIRTQVSAAHSKEDIDYIVKCFIETRDELKEAN